MGVSVDKSIDLFMATFLLLVIFFLTIIATNFILSNLFKKLDEVYAVSTSKSIIAGITLNPGYPPDITQTDYKDPIWQYGGLAYAEYKPILNYKLKVLYSPPVRVYYGVIDPMKVYHLQVLGMENNYVVLKRFLGIPDGMDFNLYIEMPVSTDIIQTKNFWSTMQQFEETYNGKNTPLLLLRELDTPFKYIKGYVITPDVKCGEEYCLPLTDNINLLNSKYFSGFKLIQDNNTQYYGVSFGIIPYDGTALEYLVDTYQKFLSLYYPSSNPRVTNIVTSDLGNRIDVSTESAYPIYSRYLNIINPDFSYEFPQYGLLRMELLLNNVAYKPSIHNSNDAHIIARFIYLPVSYYSSNSIKMELQKKIVQIEKEAKPFDMMLQIMFIPNVENPNQVKVEQVVAIIEQDDLGLTIKRIFTPTESMNSNTQSSTNTQKFFYVFTYHWEPYLEQKGYDDFAINKIAQEYGHKVPLTVKIYIKYIYNGESYIKAFSFKVSPWEQQDEGLLTSISNGINRLYTLLTKFGETNDTLYKLYKLYDLYYKDIGFRDVII